MSWHAYKKSCSSDFLSFVNFLFPLSYQIRQAQSITWKSESKRPVQHCMDLLMPCNDKFLRMRWFKVVIILKTYQGWKYRACNVSFSSSKSKLLHKISTMHCNVIFESNNERSPVLFLLLDATMCDIKLVFFQIRVKLQLFHAQNKKKQMLQHAPPKVF